MLLPRILKTSNCNRFQLICQVFYSRRGSWKYFGSYKLRFPRPKNEIRGMPSNKLTSVDNWELFPHQSFRFYLPGKIGLGWHDTVSLSLMPTTMGESDGTEMECSVQDCPILLRKGVSELFPETDPDKSPMTIVTLSQKAQQEDQDLEKLTKEFTLVAQETCYKLKLAGYWADFINPFSGLPFFSPFKGNKLYKTDVRRQCRQFNILLTGSCRIISDKEAEKFSGNLFTTAPASVALLYHVLKHYG